MLHRLIVGSLVAVITIASAAPAFGADDKEGVKGGGSVLVPATGVHGTVGVRAKITTDDATSRVDLNLRAPKTGTRVQHFQGRVTSASIRADGLAYLCGEVNLLQLGTNANDGRYFEMAVRDGGQPSEGVDMLSWYRQGSPTDCTDDHPHTRQEFAAGILKVAD